MEKDIIYNADCMQIMRGIPNESIDLICTDPPYKVTQRGSGSTLIAAASLGRKAYGMEISKRFYVDACDAISKNIRQDLFNESIEERKRKEYSQQKLF